jgi:hypothetical protein
LLLTLLLISLRHRNLPLEYFPMLVYTPYESAQDRAPLPWRVYLPYSGGMTVE